MNKADEIQQIRTKIWKTKKARMNMEARIIKNNNIINCCLFLFSILLVILSLISFIETRLASLFPTNKIIKIFFEYDDVISIILSIILLCLSIKLDPANQINRIWMTRHCYTELARLEFSEKDPDELNNEYQNILVRYENHDTKDYIKSNENLEIKKIISIETYLKIVACLLLLLLITTIYLFVIK